MVWYDDEIQITQASSFGQNGAHLPTRSRTQQRWQSLVVVSHPETHGTSEFEMLEVRSVRQEEDESVSDEV